MARHAAAQTVVFGQDIDPDKAIEALDAVTYDQVVDIARGISTSSPSPSSAPTLWTSSHKRGLPRGPLWATMGGG